FRGILVRSRRAGIRTALKQTAAPHQGKKMADTRYPAMREPTRPARSSLARLREKAEKIL
ncbi:MAG: hypothetical protein K2L38_03750, partial [Dysosmobacter sp.]|nr:hypothetical protein [Dysosmobacter sp.]